MKRKRKRKGVVSFLSKKLRSRLSQGSLKAKTVVQTQKHAAPQHSDANQNIARRQTHSQAQDQTQAKPQTGQQQARQWPEHVRSVRITEQWFSELFLKCEDVKIKHYHMGDPDIPKSVILVYCEGLADTKQINEYILPRLKEMIRGEKQDFELSMELNLTEVKKTDEIPLLVFSGQLILFIEQLNLLFSLDIANMPNRKTEESNTEISIKGPRDGFVEHLPTNVALVRKRLRTTSLRCETFRIGEKSETRIALLYIEDSIQPETLNEARERIQNVNLKALTGSGPLEEILANRTYSLFPELTYSGRPDFVVDCLVRGRFAIIADGSPMALIAPVNLTLLLKSPEDSYSNFYVVSGEMVIRMVGLWISLFLPGFWVALSSYNMEQLPFPLLATLVMSRLGLPLPGPIEVVMMLGLFELFREAGLRLPKAVGQTIAVVGGIIIGDAVIRAGLASTLMVIVSAVTAVATFTLVNQTLAGAVTITRFLILLASSLLGMFGFILATIALVLYFANLKSFGVPYLSPITPLKTKDLVAAILRKPWERKVIPLRYLHGDDGNTRGGKS
jgi:hypothetical protein